MQRGSFLDRLRRALGAAPRPAEDPLTADAPAEERAAREQAESALRTRLAEAERERDELSVQLAEAERVKAILTDLGPLTLEELDQRISARLAAIEARLAALRNGA